MRFPKLREGSQYRVTIPALCGGVNLNDAPNLVEDDQLTDVKNMWWKDQALRTRPGLYTDETHGALSVHDEDFYIDSKEQKGYKNDHFDLIGDEDYYRTIFEITRDEENKSCNIYIKRLFYDGTVCIPWDTAIGTTGDVVPASGMYIDLTGNSNDIFYGHEGLVIFNTGDVYGTPYKYDGGFVDMREDIYAPLVMVNGVGATSVGDAKVTGTFYEGYNLLTPRFRARFTTDGKGIYFFLPQKNLANSEITGSYVMAGGQTFSFTIPKNSSVSTQSVSGLSVEVSRTGGYFWFKNASGAVACPSAGISSNVEITASKTGEDTFCVIGDMTFYTWFGGDSSGINGGSRLFVGGNPQRPNLIHWSDINNPLYFPENNYAYVGDSDNAVTAFGKQADMLVIFKEREIYYATYAAGEAFTAQDVIEGQVVDVTAHSAVFPLTQLSSGIGCDCPDTIQLCNNRLIWATSEAKVYVLATANQYNERNAYEISGMIRPELLKIEKDKWDKASAGDYCGHYALLVNNHMYLFDYGAPGFVHASSYARAESLQKDIEWYIWDLSLEGVNFFRFLARDTRGVIAGQVMKGDTKAYVQLYSLQGQKDVTPYFPNEDSYVHLYKDSRIQASFQTKVFDFGSPDRNKFIRRLHLGAADTADGFMSLAYITEDGVQEDVCRIGAYGDGKMREWAMTPGVNRVRQFGIRAESDGNMAVDNMVLKYEVNGEVR
ncbi:MAG: hypothetical protein ACLSS9_10845 [Acutalibacteraceae bacterium]